MDDGYPKKKEGVMVSYSKKHFDFAKGIAQPDEPQYYTVAEAMAKFNLIAGTDIYIVSKILTCRNVSTKQIYAELVSEKKRESANKISLK